MGRSHTGRAHSDRIVYNSKHNAHSINKLLNLDKNAVCQEFHKALAFCNFKGKRSYAQVLQNTTCTDYKVRHAHTAKDNTKGCNKVMGLNPLAKPFVPAKISTQVQVVLSKGTDMNTPVKQLSTTSNICAVAEIPLSNRFQVLQDMVTDTEATHAFDQCSLASRSNPIHHRECSHQCKGKRNGERNGERNDSGQLAGAPTNNRAPTCPEYWQCKQQNGVDFGCVPLSSITLFTGDPTYWETIPDIITTHKMIRQSGVPNFLGLRIPVNTQLKVKAWRHHLKDYWDQQLVDLIQYGFPLDFDRNCVLGTTIDNHASAKEYAPHVDKYIQDELRFGAMIGPFDEKPCTLHVSPFMTRDKAQSDLRRTIIDLSWPKGQAVNDGVNNNIYLGSEFDMHYPTVDKIVKQLNSIGPAANIFKVDISRAFRHIRIDPGDIDLLGLQHQGKYFIDLSLPFGYKLGSFFFMKISDAVRYIMNNNGHNSMLNYIDDLIYTALPSTIHKSYQFLLNLLQQLGLDISSKKLHPPSTQAVCLGILFNTVDRTISIPPEKLQEIIDMCKNWSKNATCTKNKLQSLLGSLLYVSKCVKPARVFLNRMLQVLRQQAHKPILTLPTAFFKDLQWFNTFLTQYNGVTMYEVRPVSADIFLDASLTGLGGVFGHQVYALALPKHFMNYTIVHLEILNIVVALKVWGQSWANKRIQIFCDNRAVVDTLNSGRARDDILATCARNIWLLTAMFNITLVTSHVYGAKNALADLLSRWGKTPDNEEKLAQFIKNPIWVDTHLDLTLLNYSI